MVVNFNDLFSPLSVKYLQIIMNYVYENGGLDRAPLENDNFDDRTILKKIKKNSCQS